MHVEKYERSAAGHMLRHYNRTASHMSNKEIDSSRTKQNYNLCLREEPDIEYYKRRLSEVKCQNRKDVKTLCDWIITLPKLKFTEKGERLFFQSAYQELCRRYGEKNVVSAWVHKDEAGQPHMHCCFIPVVIDKRKGIEKVSAKEALTRQELRSIHKDMTDVMKKCFGRDVGILNGSTVGGNRSVAELKAKSLWEEISALYEVKEQSIDELAQALKKQPSLLSAINRAVKMVLGKEKPPIQQERPRERSR